MRGLFINYETPETVTCGLIKRHHEMPVDTYIFDDAITNVMDFHDIGRHIYEFVEGMVGITVTDGMGINQSRCTDTRIFCGQRKLVVYVTGLTAVTAELVKVCAVFGIHLTLMHYDASTGGYVPQRIFF